MTATDVGEGRIRGLDFRPMIHASTPSRRRWLGGALGCLTVTGMDLSGVVSAAGKTPAGAPLHSRKIPKTGKTLPVIGMGTWQTFDVAPSPAALEPLRSVLEVFFAEGGRVLDTSPMYGRAEETLGSLLGAKRSHAFLATKVWTRGKQAGTRQMEASLAKLQVERIDLMQVHNLVDVETHLPTLRAWKKEGRIRHLGVTHYRLDAFDKLESILRSEALDFVQLPYSVAVREAENRLLACAADTGTAVLVMRPFEGGSLFQRVRGRSLPPWASDYAITSWAQFFLKFILAHPAVTCPIPATSKPHHMRDNMGAGRGPMPGPALREKMAAALA